MAFNFIVDATADSVGFQSVNTPSAHTNIFMWGPGKQYAISFEWAQGQFTDQYGPTTTGRDVSFGSETLSTGAAALPGQGFSGWKNFAGTFTASTASQTLPFLAIGGPYGLPLFVLLDGVKPTEVPAVPEPGTPALMLAGFGLVGVMVKRRQRAA